jgi:hypothetical protein
VIHDPPFPLVVWKLRFAIDVGQTGDRDLDMTARLAASAWARDLAAAELQRRARLS